MTSGLSPNSLKLSVLIPVRNEGLNIKIMLKILHAAIEIPHEVLIVYDHPDDTSIEAVNSLKDKYPNIGGVDIWEYSDSPPGHNINPVLWSKFMYYL